MRPPGLDLALINGVAMDSVIFDLADGVATLTINRPEARNSVDRSVAVGLREGIEAIENDPAIRVGILYGAGGTFCAGMDLKSFLKGEQVKFPASGFAGITERRLSKPMLAAVEGYAVAGGFEVALACDLIIAARDAKFGLPEVRRGLVANAGGLLRLPRQIPFRIAMELVLTGELLDAPVLANHGLINRLVEPGEALSEARKLASVIASNGPLATSVSKQVVTESQDWKSREMFKLQNEITAAVFKSQDAREGALAFAEKRQPRWRGL